MLNKLIGIKNNKIIILIEVMFSWLQRNKQLLNKTMKQILRKYDTLLIYYLFLLFTKSIPR